jgi:hypothetical protein
MLRRKPCKIKHKKRLLKRRKSLSDSEIKFKALNSLLLFLLQPEKPLPLRFFKM